jgi:hypothetical protein
LNNEYSKLKRFKVYIPSFKIGEFRSCKEDFSKKKTFVERTGYDVNASILGGILFHKRVESWA